VYDKYMPEVKLKFLWW